METITVVETTAAPAVNPETTAAPAVKEAKPIKAGEFNGWAKVWQTEAFGDMVRAGLPREVAHKVAGDFGSDLGRLTSGGEGAVKVGRPSGGDSLSSVTARLKGKQVTTNSLRLIRAAQQIAALVKEGLLASRKLPELSETLAEYVTAQSKWAAGQKWEE